MFYPGLGEVKNLSKDYKLIPVSMEVYADMETPISLFKRFKGSGHAFLLESVEGGEKWGRYSFIGRNPFLTVKSYNGKTIVTGRDNNIKEAEGDPLDILKNLLDDYKGAPIKGLPRFNGGAVGYLGYDIMRCRECFNDSFNDEMGMPQCYFIFANEVIAFDHLKQKIHIIVNMYTDGSIERNYNSSIGRIKEIYKEIRSTHFKIYDNSGFSLKKKESTIVCKSNMTKEQFCRNVDKAKEYIKKGDVLQVVLSQRLSIRTQLDPFSVYRALRVINPSPYMFYLEFDKFKVAGSSPEMLLRVENGMAETCPIGGTRRRGKTKKEDAELEKELLSDEKECMEHMMLVELAKKDIACIAKTGTVTVTDLMHIEKYSHVMHIVTNVSGELCDNKNSFDALKSMFPAGTLSGVPRNKAIEIIDKIEPVKRGVYGGAIGYLSFNGNFDSCITIRTVIFKEETAYIQAGAGIVEDSDPEKEYEESMRKANALLAAIEEAGEVSAHNPGVNSNVITEY